MAVAGILNAKQAEPDRIDVPRGWLYRVLIPNKKVSEARSVSLSPVHSRTTQILCLVRSLPTTTSFTNLLVKHHHQHLLLSMQNGEPNFF